MRLWRLDVRSIFGVLGLVIILLVVGVLVKKQLTGTPPSVAAMPAGLPTTTATTGNTRQQQAQEVQQQFKEALDTALQQPRPMPDDEKQ
jgi:hypothetical protein